MWDSNLSLFVFCPYFFLHTFLLSCDPLYMLLHFFPFSLVIEPNLLYHNSFPSPSHREVDSNSPSYLSTFPHFLTHLVHRILSSGTLLLQQMRSSLKASHFPISLLLLLVQGGVLLCYRAVLSNSHARGCVAVPISSPAYTFPLSALLLVHPCIADLLHPCIADLCPCIADLSLHCWSLSLNCWSSPGSCHILIMQSSHLSWSFILSFSTELFISQILHYFLFSL